MNDYISISTLNDFIFCPYSIYLHNVYMEADEDIFKATPQIRGTQAHSGVDKKTGSSRSCDILSLPVCSNTLGLYGVIDIYKSDKALLIERKYQLKNIYRGQLYQLWAQYFCMTEMGYEVRQIAFYEISTNKLLPQATPKQAEKEELIDYLAALRSYNPVSDKSKPNPNKCVHCIYCNLCDKTELDNVYT